MSRSVRIVDLGWTRMRVIKQVLGKEVHTGGQVHAGWLRDNASRPRPIPKESALVDVRILEDVEGFILEFEFQNASIANDSWHASIKEAEDEAKIKFGIERSEWTNYHNADI